MVTEFDASRLRGVICLFCGTRTVLPHLGDRGQTLPSHVEAESHVALIRCRLCLREAPYGPKEIVEFRDVA